ncbi:MAG: NYN domain-containing protein [Holophagales bacterium]|nr:NYN domain-containing protein [Holophagales bacterium]
MMRCAVFIDGNNVFHSARQLGFEVDYSKLLEMLTGKDRELLRAFFYTGVDESADRQRGFLHWMRRNGFRVVQKSVRVDRDGTRRAHLEVEIATDMMAFADKVDTIVLVSGDEDFAYPLSVLAQRGVRIEVAGFRSAMANKIMDCADRYIDLDSLMDKFRKDSSYEEEDPDDFRERL